MTKAACGFAYSPLTTPPSTAVTEKRPGLKRWLIAAVKLLIVAAILWWIQGTIVDGWREFRQRDEGQWTWHPEWLLAAAGLYLAGLLFFALFWHRSLRVLGQRVRLRDTLAAYYIGHLGKYVPGKAMVVVMRVGLIRGGRVSTGVAAVSVFMETLTMMAVGAFLASAYLLFSGQQLLWSLAAAGLMVVSLGPTVPPVFKRLARLAGVGRRDPEAAEKLDKLGYRVLAVGWVMSLAGWILLALSYWATLRAMGIEGLDPIADLPRYTAGVALAVVAGFLLLILPGGVGVREAFLAELIHGYLKDLGHSHPTATAWASAFLLRLIWTGAELAISAVFWCLRRRKEKPRRTPAGGELP